MPGFLDVLLMALSLASGCRTSTNDPNLGRSLREDTSSRRCLSEYPTMISRLVRRVFGIVEDPRQRITESRRGFFERDSVVAAVLFGFCWIPLELKAHRTAGARLPRTVSACALVQVS